MTVDDIQRVAPAYLKPDRLSVVLVGNASVFATQLKGVGFGSFETIELADLDLMTANLKRAGARADAGVRGAGWAGSSGLAGRVNYHQAPLGSRPATEPSADARANAMALV